MVRLLILFIGPLVVGWLLDCLLGDPWWLPHPIVAFGKFISWGEKRLNRGKNRKLKGALLAFVLIIGVFVVWGLLWFALFMIHPWLWFAFHALSVFFFLAGKTLICEVQHVFTAVNRSVDEGRCQVARIVGRDTSGLDCQQIRRAGLETLSENLSDGVVAPLFWYLLLGVPGMAAYKMVNTLDSMIGYKSDRFKDFGCIAARIDDVANYIPARLTALLLVVCNGRFSLLGFVKEYAHCHASPNSGYPESAMAGILNCRFGGPNVYFGKRVEKPYIGFNDRVLSTDDLRIAVGMNRRVACCMIILVILFRLFYFLYL